MNFLNSIPGIIKTGIFFIFFIVSLFFSDYFFYPFVFGKTIIFEIIIEFLFGLWIFLVIFKKEYLPRFNILAWTIIGFFGVLAMTTIFSQDISRSFWGDFNRMSGLFTLLHFLIFFFIIISIFQKKEEWEKLFKFSVFVSFLVAAYALGQKLNIPFLFGAGAGPITGTLGNPALLAIYLVFHIFLIIYFFLKTRNKWWNVFLGVGILLELFALLLTSNRGAILGMVLGSIIFLILFLFLTRNWQIKKYALGILILIFFLSLVLFLNQSNQWVKNNSYLEKISSINSQNTTVKTRLITWSLSLKAFKEKPLIGWGPENYDLAFNKYFNPSLFNYGYGETWFDRAHNKILDQAVMNGILGVISYIFIFFVSLYLIFRFIKKEDVLLSIILVAILSSYFIQNLFLFDSPASYLLFFLILGFICFKSSSPIELDKNQKNADKRAETRQRKLNYNPYAQSASITFYGVFIMLVTVFSAVMIHRNDLTASYYVQKAQMSWSDSDYKIPLNYLKKAVSFNSFGNEEIGLVFSRFAVDKFKKKPFSDNILTNEEKKIVLNSAIELEKENITQHPLDARPRVILGGLYNLLAEIDSSAISKAEEILKQALNLSPEKQQIYFELSQTYSLKKDYENMIFVLQKSLALSPEVADSNWKLGIGFIKTGKQQIGVQKLEKAMELGYRYQNSDDLLILAEVYANAGLYQKTIFFYKELVLLDSQNPFYHSFLAAAYAKAGDKKNAIEETRKAIELDLRFKEKGEEFIESLKD